MLAGFALLLAGCTKPAPDEPAPLAGRWEGNFDRVEFFAEGHVLLTRHQHWRGLGQYAVVEPGRVVLRFDGPFAAAEVDDFRFRIAGDTARFCETYRPERCMDLVRASADWIEPPGRWVDTVPVRFANPPRIGTARDGRAIRAEMALRQLHALQTAFHAEEGRYTRDLQELERVGWEGADVPGYRLPEVSGDDERLCIVALPATAELPALYVNAEGRMGYGAACPGGG